MGWLRLPTSPEKVIFLVSPRSRSQTSMAAEPSRCPTSVMRRETQSFTWITRP